MKQLEKLNYSSEKQTIIDTAIQEKSYQKDITKLQRMISDYNECLTGMKDVDYVLLERHILALNAKIKHGESYNLCSTVISKFVIDCDRMIDEFKAQKMLMNQIANRI